jgi:hypothetical protein
VQLHCSCLRPAGPPAPCWPACTLQERWNLKAAHSLQKQDTLGQEQIIFFIGAVPKIRKLSCSFQDKKKGNYFLKNLSNSGISTFEVYMARKHSPVISKESFRPAQLPQQLFF